jgi:outer membrane biosynthesis protein TonB
VADAHDPFPACDVCGRTILKGEQIHEYLTPQRERIRVCVLCRSRAETSGWIPVSMAHTLEDEQPRRSRGQALRKRLGRAASRARSSARSRRGSGRDADRDAGQQDFEQAWDEPAAAPEPFGAEDQATMAPEPPQAEAEPPPMEAPVPPEPTEMEPEAAPEPEPAPAPAAPAPEAAKQAEPAKPRKAAKPPPRRQPRARTAKGSAKTTGEQAKPARKSPAKRGPEALMRRAVERFNSSEERRKVAGLIRSLGEPQAGVRPDPRRQLAVVTVGWELSWYQWEVGADGEGDDSEPVREVAKGAELSELAEESRSWNAAVDEDGALRLRAADRQTQEAAKEA